MSKCLKAVLPIVLMSCCLSGFTQSSAPTLPEAPQPNVSDGITVLRLPLNVVKDQIPIFTSPVRIRRRDLKWLVPLTAATGASLATDHHTMTEVVSHDPGFNQENVNASNALVGVIIAAPVALFVEGRLKDNEHDRETGLLGGEAMVDGLIAEQILKLSFWRERPAQDNGRGLFYQGGAHANSSFPSSHATVAWSSAAVLAAESHSHWQQAGIYTLATGVSLTRVLGQQHFPTDVLVGSAAGWLIGHYVYHARHHSILH